ncbi:Uncharacterized protein conserved in bacteria [uncultured Clostridium sp.]|uniref:Acyltransferase n=1 Tax=Muricoprocola aceti TaxID=2981772 RepID=A0ABT2SPP8_9FIRM|nr:acyltransferase [Muricoprocola aceti]MCU6726494.1 acyltransferase [Muricoprocola aceti]SCH92375.1 Uncharacterized protein conserved in bacteria [uncultured Clostridium sp.]
MAQNRNNNIAMIKFIAAIMVITGHMAYILGVSLPIVMGTGIQIIGVKIFFLIGGYLITKSWLSDPVPKRYAEKRFMRIVPPLLVYTIIAILFSGIFLSTLTLKEYFTNPVTWKYLKNIIFCIEYFLPGVFQNNIYPNAVNGSLWTLPVEVGLYIVIPIVIKVLKLDKEKKHILLYTITVGVCLFQLLHLLCFPTWTCIYYQTDWASAMALVPYYFIGMLYAISNLHEKLNLQLACFLMLITPCISRGEIVNEIILYTVFPYFVFSFAFSPKAYFSNVFSKGDISYGMYLYGFFVQQIIANYLVNTSININKTRMLWLIVSILVTIIMALITNKIVEKPVQKKLQTHLYGNTEKV